MTEERELLDIGADVDVRALMEEIRAEVDRKRREGLYPPDVDAEMDLASDGRRAGPEVLSRIVRDLERSSGFSADVTTASQKPVVAPMVAGAKRAIRTSVRWYMAGVLQQVTLFAANVVRAVRVISDRVGDLEDGLEAVGDQMGEVDRRLQAVEELPARMDGLDQRLTSLEAERVADRLARLDRAVRDLRRRLEDGVVSGPAEAKIADPLGDRSRDIERAHDYFEFENRFRGSEQDIEERQRRYVDVFRGAPGKVADLGCGRGEFLSALKGSGIDGYGVDRHPDMVAACRERGLEIEEADVLDHLAALQPRSLGGIFAAQMIEHLDARDVPRFFELAAEVLAEGGQLVVETPNPESLFVFANAFYLDLGHLRPLHPLLLKFLAETSGFADARIEYLSPPPDHVRLRSLPATQDAPLGQVVDRVNENLDRIDRILFGPQDYALIARR